MIAQATEGVWGLACDARDDEAVLRLIELKGRPTDKGLIVALASAKAAEPALGGVNAEQRAEILASWPGHVTWLVPDCGDLALSPLVRGVAGRVALRVPNHEQMRRVMTLAQMPIITSSANPSGAPAAMSSLTVRRYFGRTVDFVLPGELGGALGASEVRDAVTGVVLRPRVEESSGAGS